MKEYIPKDEVLKLWKYWKYIEAYDQTAEMKGIKTKTIQYFDEDTKVWTIGEVIVDEAN
jgi:hypothetical protein